MENWIILGMDMLKFSKLIIKEVKLKNIENDFSIILLYYISYSNLYNDP